MSRVPLSQIRSLTFVAGKNTKARRLQPIPQLTCVGDGCKYYQPEVVRCTNAGGDGTDVDWTCEADLPEKLRFGRVEVSCEGWEYPGDPFVLKGSCGLEYRLVRVRNLDKEPVWSNKHPGQYFDRENLPSTVFSILWGLVLVFILYSMFKSCFTANNSDANTRPPPRPPRSSFPGGFNSGDFTDRPPPPYDESWKRSSGNAPAGDSGSWAGPGFWSGLGLGGVGGAMAGRYFAGASGMSGRRVTPPVAAPYDWECDVRPRSGWFSSPPPQQPVRRFRDDDRGEGSSNLGSMRRSTGFGVSNVR